ncbi:MAG: DUF4123 domain-containing protein [Aliivibrio sp.]|uniref:DUF4123 domain-containing protein n=1 Tax=Aliivibrio sp. TaxID=1872443 RepID=UPI001A534601|nr:DUF4123 domain-containing protein [Aliivibrio sp.]
MQVSDTLNIQNNLNLELHHYLVATHTSTMAKDIYTHTKSPDIAPLYINTVLADLFKCSPYVVRVFPNDNLIEQYQHKAKLTKNWSGIIVSVSSSTSFEALLSHLRCRLMITFEGQRKGILHYYNPIVANYFFDGPNTTDTDNWLGPIKQVCWYGSNHSPNQSLWCKIDNSSLTESEISTWVMTPSQQASLEILYDDQILANFLTSTSQTINNREEWYQHRHYFSQAEHLGFIDIDHIYAYLSLCREHGSIDNTVFNSKKFTRFSPAEKIQYLTSILKKDSVYVS